MYPDEPQARIGYQSGAISRAKQFAVKALIVLGGALMIASLFVLSLVFLAIGLGIVVIFGGYLWWKTRDLRKQLRARMQAQSHTRYGGDVIEGEVISREQPRR
jgi:FtsH-binding integral membrane protein